MKKYRYVRALEGAPEGKIRRLSVQDAAPLIKSGAIVEHDGDDDEDDPDASKEQSLVDRNERLTAEWNDAVHARDAAIVERDDALKQRDSAHQHVEQVEAERDKALQDLESANSLLADTSQLDQLRGDLDAALKRAEQAEADLAALKAPQPPVETDAADGSLSAAKPSKSVK